MRFLDKDDIQGAMDFVAQDGITEKEQRVIDMLQSSSVPDDTSEFSLQIDVTTADASIDSSDFYAIRYDVEGYDMLQFGFGSSSAQNLTLSFWVRSAKT